MTRPLHAGERNELVQLQRRVVGQDSLGQASESWDQIAEVWAEARQLEGREWFSAGQTQSGIDVVFKILGRSGVQPTWRVVWRSQPYDVVSVIRLGAAQLELACRGVIKDPL